MHYSYYKFDAFFLLLLKSYGVLMKKDLCDMMYITATHIGVDPTLTIFVLITYSLFLDSMD